MTTAAPADASHVSAGASPGTSADRGGPTALLVSADPGVVREVERFAAAAGAVLETTTDPARAAYRWEAAATVLVGADLAAELARHGVRRRDGTYLVSAGVAGDECFRWAVGLGAAAVLELPDAGDWLVGALTDLDGGAGATTVAVVGGSGGVGASTLAAAVALRAAAGRRATLVDLDPDGPGAQRLLGLDGQEGEVTWHELAASRGRLGAAALRDSLPGRDALRVLGWPAEPGAEPRVEASRLPVTEILGTVRRGSDWVVLDLPRSGPDLPVVQLEPLDHLVVVVRPTVTGVAAAARTLDRLQTLRAPAGLVVRTRRGSPLTGDVARALGVPVLAELPDQRRLDEHLDLGLGPAHERRSPLVRTADALLRGWSG